jgi:hypothetical protein
MQQKFQILIVLILLFLIPSIVLGGFLDSIKKISEVLFKSFKKPIQSPLTSSAGEKFITEFKEKIQQLQTRIKELEERPPQIKEEIRKETVVQPIKEIEKRIQFIPSEELAKIESRLSALEEIANKIQPHPPEATAPNSPIYIPQGIQTGGAGIFSSISAESAAFRILGVGASVTLGSAPQDKLTINASSQFTAPIIVGENALTIDTSGNLTVKGNLHVSTTSTFMGNVGVGTATPISLLELYKTDASPILTITAASTTYSPQIQFRIGATPETKFTFGIDPSTGNLKLIPGSEISTSTGLTIDSLGRIGIGTTTPEEILDVVGRIRIQGVGTSSAQILSILESGSMAEEASYIVFTDSTGKYFAKNGKTGKIEYSDTNAFNVIQYALSSMSGGGRLVIKDGIYYIPQPLLFNYDSDIIIEGSGAIIVPTNSNITIFDLRASSFGAGYRLYTAVKGIRFWNQYGVTDVTAIKVTNRTASMIVQNVVVDLATAVVVEGAESAFIAFNNLYTKGDGVVLNVADSHIIGNRIGYGSRGIVGSVGGSIIEGNFIWGMSNNGIEIVGDKNIIIGNHIEDCLNGIQIRGHQNIINSNNIGYLKSGGIGIYLKYSGEWTTIVGGRFHELPIGIKLEGDVNATIADNFFVNVGNGIVLEGGDERTHIHNNIFDNVTTPISGSRVPYIGLIKHNKGYTTENKGTAVIPAGTTSVTVAHGLVGTPNVVKVTPRANIGAVWVSARDATNITISSETTSTQDVIVDWEAEL